jgi:hypothetical protein
MSMFCDSIDILKECVDGVDVVRTPNGVLFQRTYDCDVARSIWRMSEPPIPPLLETLEGGVLLADFCDDCGRRGLKQSLDG